MSKDLECPDCEGLGEYSFPEGAAGPAGGDGWYECGTCKGTGEKNRWLLYGPRKYTAQLAGSITGMPDLNRQAFAAAAEKVAALGYQVWNPNDWSDLNPDIDPESQSREFWMRRSIRKLFNSDLLVMLQGWMPSDGAMAERVVARQFGMPVVYLFDRPSAYRCEWRRH